MVVPGGNLIVKEISTTTISLWQAYILGGKILSSGPNDSIFHLLLGENRLGPAKDRNLYLQKICLRRHVLPPKRYSEGERERRKVNLDILFSSFLPSEFLLRERQAGRHVLSGWLFFLSFAFTFGGRRKATNKSQPKDKNHDD